MINIFTAGVAGLLIGILVTRRLMSKEVARAYEIAKKEFEEKRVELSDKIGDQLSDMRSGLVRTLEAYVSTVSVVREHLPISAEKLNELIAPAKLRLTSASNKQNDKETSIAVEIEAAPDEVEQLEAVDSVDSVDSVDNYNIKPNVEQDLQSSANKTSAVEPESEQLRDTSKLN